jgi:hypothetical protein
MHIAPDKWDTTPKLCTVKHQNIFIKCLKTSYLLLFTAFYFIHGLGACIPIICTNPQSRYRPSNRRWKITGEKTVYISAARTVVRLCPITRTSNGNRSKPHVLHRIRLQRFFPDRRPCIYGPSGSDHCDNSKMMKRAFIFAVVLPIAGCVSDVANRYYASEHYPAKPVASVQLLYAAPAAPYVAIADFQSRGETPETLRQKAADIGADAVIVAGIGGSHNGGAEWAGGTSNQDYSHIVGTAIKFK